MSACTDYQTATHQAGAATHLNEQADIYKRLLEGVAAATNLLITGFDYSESISQAIAILGKATQVERTYIFETHPYGDSGKPAMSQRWEWAAPGIPPEIDNPELQNLLFEDCFPRWYEELSKGQPVYGFVEDFPAVEKEILAPQGILSIVVVPIQIRDRFWGFIGFDQCSIQHQWTEVEISTLRAIAGCLGGTIAHHNTETALQELNHSLEKRVTQRTEELTAANQELSIAMDSLQEAQAQLIHTEKMSSLGQLVAGVAHEINNPANFIQGNLRHAKRYSQELISLVELYQEEYPDETEEISAALDEIDIDFLKEDFTKLIEAAQEGTSRIAHVVQSLRTFSRLDESDYKLVNIHDGLESSLLFLQHRLEPTDHTKRIKVLTQFDTQLPLVGCYSGTLNQAIMHVLTNAIDALEAKSPAECEQRPNQLEITTALAAPVPDPKATQKISQGIGQQQMLLRITDNGDGITAANQAKMFDPFFTTRPIGHRTGLGLSIAHQVIVKEHNGEINCRSICGEGTTFEIRLPIQQTA